MAYISPNATHQGTRYCDVCDTDNYRHATGCDVISQCGCGMADCSACMRTLGMRAALPFPRHRIRYAEVD